MKFISYILLLFFILNISGRSTSLYSIKKIKKLSEAKSNTASDLDEEPKTDDKDEKEKEKENTEKYIPVWDVQTHVSFISFLKKHNLIFKNLLLTSRCKEIIIPPPEQA